MSLVIYNTLGRKKEPFTPISPPHVKLYLCGPTVYDLLHVGNFRGVIFFNLVRNWLTALDYQVTFALNFTDIDDKIIAKANEEGTEPVELSHRYIVEYQKDYQRLQLPPHDINPTCTHHISDMVDFISKLIDKNHAYCVEGSVFFKIKSFSGYGALSGKQLDDLQSGHRVDPDPRKENPLDFILWKPAKEGEPSWDSPWGPGRPGWHIECSAMNHAHFGEQIDIHGGGIDLIFPHHENEIAQSEALTGKPFSKYWMHNNFIRFGDEKMSKSLGNVVKARDFMATYDPEILKYLMLSAHYRSELNFETQQVHHAISALSRIYHALKVAETLSDPLAPHHPEFSQRLSTADEAITQALNDDFNTPKAFATVFDVIRDFNQLTQTLKRKNKQLHSASALLLQWVRRWGKHMSLFQQPPSDFLTTLDAIIMAIKKVSKEQIQALVDARTLARKEKDFAKSDAIRDELINLGVLIHDLPNETQWEMNKQL